MGRQDGGSITASYATGAAAGGDGNFDRVGGLVGVQGGGSITASYATGVAAGGDGNEDYIGGLVGYQSGGSITASYATGVAAGGGGNSDLVGGLVGRRYGSIRASYGFGGAVGELTGSAGSTKPSGVSTAAQLTAANAGASWNNANKNTLGAWDFGDETRTPALNYADYDGTGAAFDCGPNPSHFLADACGTLLPGQDAARAGGPSAVGFGETALLAGSLGYGRVLIESWSWRQLQGLDVALSNANARETSFTAPATSTLLVFELTATDSEGRQYSDRISLAVMIKADRDGDGLIEIDSLLGLHNMRHNLAGTSYKSGAASVGNSFGCPDTGCEGYELMQDLDFDGDEDGSTWQGDSGGGYTLDADDSQADYFPVESGAGGWLPIGDATNPFAAVFDGNSHIISNLAIRRDQTHVGLFGVIGGGAAIRNLGLIDNLADYTGSSDGGIYIGGLVGRQNDASITASYATGAAAGGDGYLDRVGGLVGQQELGSITASWATGAAAGGGGNDDAVGGLVGFQGQRGSITASRATGAADGGDGNSDYAGGLVGLQRGSITASYATGAATGGDGNSDYAGGLVGSRGGGSITASYGFGRAIGELAGSAGSTKPQGVGMAAQLTAANAGPSWNDAGNNTLGAWNFGDETQTPALNYADYDGAGIDFDCGGPNPSHFPANACGALLPGQIDQADASAGGPSAVEPGETVRLAGSLGFGRVLIASWSWLQLQGPEVALSNANDRKTSFTAPAISTHLLFELTATDSEGRQYTDSISLAVMLKADRDGDGLIEIDSLFRLHNMRHNLAGTSYKSGAASVGNSFGCPETGCKGYELMRDLDFDGDEDGSSWQGNSNWGYILDADDSQADYFPLAGGAGGWLPIGDATNPFAAVFDGNGHSISNLAIRRDQTHIGLFGAIGRGAAIRNLGLIDNLADYTGSSDSGIYIGGLVGLKFGGSITASWSTGFAAGGDGNSDYVGGLVGWQGGGSITASWATGTAAGGDGNSDYVGGLVGLQEEGSITASYSTGAAAGGAGDDDSVGGLVGYRSGGLITASYATGAADGGDGDDDSAGGLVGYRSGGLITANYATDAADGGDGNSDYAGGPVGYADDSITESYGFGSETGETEGSVGSEKPQGVSTAAQLTAANAGAAWNDAGNNTLGAWNFDTDGQIPALNYADYDGAGAAFDCSKFPANACGTLLPGQNVVSAGGPSAVGFGETVRLAGSLGFDRVLIKSWSWRQLEGPEVALSNANARETSFTAPATSTHLLFELTATDSKGRQYTNRISLAVMLKADRDGNGLIEIDGLLMLHNMRHNLAGTSYKSGAESVGNSFGCPETGCKGYELMRDLDFDGDEDGSTWQGDSDGGYTLDADDSRADYFPVISGAGGWLPIGDATNPFAAVFDGNGHSISNLAIRRDQTHVGLFGRTGGSAAIRNLGLIDNLADYTGSSDDDVYIGSLVGLQGDASVTASYATGAAAGGDGDYDSVGGLVGQQDGGSITASWATGAAAGGDGGFERVGGLVGQQLGGSITASYATGAAAGGNGDDDSVGGLVGYQSGGSITASYATGAVAGGDGDYDNVGGLVGYAGGSIMASYGFGVAVGETAGSAGSTKPSGVSTAAQLTAANAGSSWNNADNNTLGAWDFGDESQIPALNYADYDGADVAFDCGPNPSHFPANACGNLLPGQIEPAEANAGGPSAVGFGETVWLAGSLVFGRVPIESWSWRQLEGPEVALSNANARETSFIAPVTSSHLLFKLTATDSKSRQYTDRISLAVMLKADRDGNGLIEIDGLLMLHNMRHNLAGTSYKSGAESVGNSFGCPDTGCKGYELMRDLDFDGDEDGSTWQGDSDGGYTLDLNDSRADYFPVESGAGGWLPIGDATNPFAAVFDGNGHSISNLAIRRDQTHVGLFGAIGGGAAMRNLGLIDNLADYTGSSYSGIYIGGLVGLQSGGSITASWVTGVAAGGDGDYNYIGGLVGQQGGGSIMASWATGAAIGGGGNFDNVGGLVGLQVGGLITESYATGVAAGGDGSDRVGGLVGWQDGGLITANWATGAASGGDGISDLVGGLVGWQDGGLITASWATGAAAGGDGNFDKVGGLVGNQSYRGSITASYATGAAAGGDGNSDYAGGLVGYAGGSITASYGFGRTIGEVAGSAGSTKPSGISTADQLTAANAGSSWNDADNNTLGAWDFGDETQIPALNYADYDGDGDVFDCGHFPANACGTLLPGQNDVSAGGPSAVEPGEIVRLAGSLGSGRALIESWSWRQLEGPEVALSNDNAREASFTAPATSTLLLFELTSTDSEDRRYTDRISLAVMIKADRDGDGLIEIDSLLMLHNMRHNLAGTSYKSGAELVGNSFGCPDTGCKGYELMRDLDFDGDEDGGTWRGDSDGGYALDADDSQADYFPVEGGAGGWLPIGDATNPFAVVFDGNSHTISSLAIRRDQTHVGLFGVIGGGAAIRNLGLIDNLADYTGSSYSGICTGGLVGLQSGGSITASWATGAAVGGDGNYDNVGGLVGWQGGGSITASWATGAAAGGNGDYDRAGGLVGRQSGGSITASYASGAAAGGDGYYDSVGGLVGEQSGGSIAASYATGAAAGGYGNDDSVGGLVGKQSGGSIAASYATGAAAGGYGNDDSVGGLVGKQSGGSIAASYATGAAAGGYGNDDSVGGLVGYAGGSITASYATGAAAGGDGDYDYVGGLVGWQEEGSIAASYATGAAAGGDGDDDNVGGLVGWQGGGSITASYASGAAAGGDGYYDSVGGLVGKQSGGSIAASYATGAAAGGYGNDDSVGGLVGQQDFGSITASYGFGSETGELDGSAGSTKPQGVSTAAQLTAANAGSAWNEAGGNTLGAWDFGTDEQIPALNYADYDGDGAAFDCGQFPAAACGTLLLGQDVASAGGPSAVGFGETARLAGLLGFGRVLIESWSWRQLEGPEVALSNANARETSFTAPETNTTLLFELTATDSEGRQYSDRISLDVMPKADRDGDGLIEIDSLLMLHNMRHNLAGTGYKTSADSVGNSFGCPDTGCMGYELMLDLDFDGDEDGSTWQGDSDGGYTLDADDSQSDYFPVESGAGGWLPIGDATNPFAAVFDGNSHTISNLAIRRDQTYAGLFGAIGGGAAVRNLGLIDNLVDHTGSNDDYIYIGGLAGEQSDGSITASWATGTAVGGDGDYDYVGGLVGRQYSGSITASYAMGAADGGDGDYDYVGGLVGRQYLGSITASYATGAAVGGDGDYDYVGGLVGYQEESSITASYVTGAAAGGDGDYDYVGGLVGRQYLGSITASYAMGAAAGGDGSDDAVGGLVGYQEEGLITLSYATGAAAGGDGSDDDVGGLVGYQEEGLITASYATGAADGGDGSDDDVGGLVGYQEEGLITASYATGAADGGSGNYNYAGGLVGYAGGSITASYATGNAAGGDGYDDVVGGLVGFQSAGGSITASYATGNADGGDGGYDYAGGLVGCAGGSITASYATGNAYGGDGYDDSVGGLVGYAYGLITASYATGNAYGGDGEYDYAGGLVGYADGSITASYATGTAYGGDGEYDYAGGLVGYDYGSITASYGFGGAIGESAGSAGSIKPSGVSTAAQLTAANAGPSWNDAGNNTLGAWDFGDETQILVLNYADYDGAGVAFDCGPNPSHFPANACGTLLLGQKSRAEVSAGEPSAVGFGETAQLAGLFRFGRVLIKSWSWRQLQGPEVSLSNANARKTSFTAPATSTILLFELTATDSDGRQYNDRISLAVMIDADRDGDGLIEIDSLLMLHNMRHNLAGTSYKSGAEAVWNSLGCPDTGCKGYELMRDLDFDGDEDGSSWQGDSDGGYTLDADDSQADYFPVESGAGGWLPIGNEANPFAAVFDGNSHTISNLAIRRDQTHVGFFGVIGGGAAIRNLGLIDNLAHYTGYSNGYAYIGGLAGKQSDGSITASWATGVAAGGDGGNDYIGGLVGYQYGGSIMASYATGAVAGGDGNGDDVGGLVGQQEDGGSITASWATGAATDWGGNRDYVGGLMGKQDGGSITASWATGAAAGGDGRRDNVGGLVGHQEDGSSITASWATGAAAGGDGDSDHAGGLVGHQEDGGSITASWATGAAAGGDGDNDHAGGLVGHQKEGGSITASWATGAAAGGDGNYDDVGGLVGQQEDGSSITASWATGAADGGDGNSDHSGGLVGRQKDGSSITASYATGAAAGGDGDDDNVGGLVGRQEGGSITASYATGAAAGGDGDSDRAGRLVGRQSGGSITASYGFGSETGETEVLVGSEKPQGVRTAAKLTAANAGSYWNDAGGNTLGAWNFGDETQIPALNYADYDGTGAAFDCIQFPANACDTLLPGQDVARAGGPSAVGFGKTARLAGSLGYGRVLIESWSWRQLQGPEVALSNANARETSFTAPATSTLLLFELTATDSDGLQYTDRISHVVMINADRDGDGLIEIDSLLRLHNMRYNLAGTSYKSGAEAEGNSLGCPDTGCNGYELMRNLDFDGDKDGSTWQGDGGGGYTLDADDSQDDYFPVENGEGGWLPIGGAINPFAAVFDGNSHTISNLAIRRDRTHVGLFGVIGGGAAIRNLGLIDNLADHTGSSDSRIYIGGLVGLQDDGSITASYATGAAAGGDGDLDRVGGLVGQQEDGGSITASWATGVAAGGDGNFDYVGGLVGWQYGSITASWATGAAVGGNGDDRVGGLVGRQEAGSITASYATGAVAGGYGDDVVGGLVGWQYGSITASYATGAVAGGYGDDVVGGLVGWQYGSITASYATGAAAGGYGNLDYAGGLVGWQGGDSITASYGFGSATGETEGLVGSEKPQGVSTASQLTAANAGSYWNDAGNNTLGAWDFGDDTQIPALNYADYDGAGAAFDCGQFPAAACGTLLPWQDDAIASGPDAVGYGQTVTLVGSLRFDRVTIASWSWRQLQGPEAALSHANARETSFTVPATRDTLVFELTATDNYGLQYTDRISLAVMINADRDGDGLIEIYSLLDLHNMRHNLAGTSYKSGTASVGNSLGCPDMGCIGYELMRDLDFDGDEDGGAWQGDSYGGYTLDADDSQADYFPVESGAGGWLPIGDATDPFVAVFDGNSHSISSLAIRRDQINVGLFGVIGGGAAIRNLGLIDNLADYTGISDDYIYIGGLVGWQGDASITASYATGAAAGGDGGLDHVGGLVGWQGGGSITASYATGAVEGGDGNSDYAGGLVGWQDFGSITASYATGAAAGGDGNSDHAGGLVGYQREGSITASYAAGAADGGDGDEDLVGGLVGQQYGSITASYATGAAAGGDGNSDYAGGLVGYQKEGSITASYAAGAAAGGDGNSDYAGGLVGYQEYGSVTASYATGVAAGGDGDSDYAGGLMGWQRGVITVSYGFGSDTGELEGSAGSTKPSGVSTAAQLTAANAGSSWNNAGGNTLGAWDFGGETQIPALNYADYDDTGDVFDCGHFPANACGTLLSGQDVASAGGPSAVEPGETVRLAGSLGFGRVFIEFWSWRQLEGPEVALSNANARETSFTAPETRVPLVFELTATDSDGLQYTDRISLAVTAVAIPDTVVTLSGPALDRPLAEATAIVGDGLSLVYSYSADDLHGRVLAGNIEVAASIDGLAINAAINVVEAEGRGKITVVLRRREYPESDEHELAVTLRLSAAVEGFVLGEPSSIATTFSFLPLPPTVLEVKQAQAQAEDNQDNQGKPGAAGSDAIELGYSFDYAAENRLNRPRAGLVVQVDFELCTDAGYGECRGLPAASIRRTLDDGGSLALRVDRTAAGLGVFGEADDDSIRHGRVLLSTAGDADFAATAAATTFSFAVAASVVTLSGPALDRPPAETTAIIGDELSLVYSYSADNLRGRVLAGNIEVAASIDGLAITPDIRILGTRGGIAVVLLRQTYSDPDGHELAVSLRAAAAGFALGDPSSMTTTFSFLPLPSTVLEVRQAQAQAEDNQYNQGKPGAAGSDVIELGYSFDYAAGNRLNRPRAGLVVQVEFELCTDAGYGECRSLPAASMTLTLDDGGSLTLRVDRTAAGLSVFGEADDDSIRHGRVLLSTARDGDFAATAAATTFSFAVAASVVTLSGPVHDMSPADATAIIGDELSLVYSYSADNLRGRVLAGNIEVAASIDGLAITPEAQASASLEPRALSTGSLWFCCGRHTPTPTGTTSWLVSLSAAAEGFAFGRAQFDDNDVQLLAASADGPGGEAGPGPGRGQHDMSPADATANELSTATARRHRQRRHRAGLQLRLRPEPQRKPTA